MKANILPANVTVTRATLGFNSSQITGRTGRYQTSRRCVFQALEAGQVEHLGLAVAATVPLCIFPAGGRRGCGDLPSPAAEWRSRPCPRHARPRARFETEEPSHQGGAKFQQAPGLPGCAGDALEVRTRSRGPAPLASAPSTRTSRHLARPTHTGVRGSRPRPLLRTEEAAPDWPRAQGRAVPAPLKVAGQRPRRCQPGAPAGRRRPGRLGMKARPATPGRAVGLLTLLLPCLGLAEPSSHSGNHRSFGGVGSTLRERPPVLPSGSGPRLPGGSRLLCGRDPEWDRARDGASSGGGAPVPRGPEDSPREWEGRASLVPRGP